MTKARTMAIDADELERAVHTIIRALREAKVTRIVGLTAMQVIIRCEFEHDGMVVVPLKADEVEDEAVSSEIH